MNWTCAQTDERLSDYLDRLLGADERAAFEKHTQGCANCRQLMQQVAGTVSQIHALEPLEPPSQLAYSILDMTLGPRKETAGGWKGLLGWTEFLWQPRFAMGTASVAFSLLIVFSSLGVDWKNLSAKDFHPVNMYHAADKQAHLMYARGAKFINDLRVVYEIQSRLQTEPAPAQPSDNRPQQPKQGTQPKAEPGRERNRAEETNPNLLIVASAWSGLSGRSSS